MKQNKGRGEANWLREIGERLAQKRLDQNLKQVELAEEAGVGLRTLQRLERGEVATRLSTFVRVCEVLGLMEGMDLFLPEPKMSPMALLRVEEERPKRASRKRGKVGRVKEWSWGE